MPAQAALRTRRRSFYPHGTAHAMRWSDNDQYGHVNNSVYAFLIDSVVNEYLIASCGLSPSPSPSPSSEARIGLVVASYCHYFAPLAFPERVRLGLAVRRIGASSVEYEVGFFRDVAAADDDDEQQVCAVGGFTHVFVDRHTRRPVGRIDGALRAGLERILVREEARL